jgi:long-chain acyl-CoA synthetase
MNKHFTNLVEMLDDVTRTYPYNTALIFGSRKITYEKLLRQTKQLSFALQNLGIAKADKVALWLPNCPEFVISFFAIIRAGASVVPINTMFKQEETNFIVEDCGAKILICSIDKVPESEIILSRVKTLNYVLSLPAPKNNRVVIDFYGCIKNAPQFDGYTMYDEGIPAEIVYTSGTTGKPKGACLTHKNLLSNITDCAAIIKFSKRDRLICVLPLFHYFASTVCMLLPLHKGATIVIMRAVRPFKRIIRTIFKHRITIFVGIPSFFSILGEASFPKLSLFFLRFINPVRLCISGAAALPFEVWQKFEKRFRRPLLQGYGLTEASPVVSLNPLKGRRKPESIGIPLPTVRVKIVDKEGCQLRRGGIGELLVKVDNVMSQYYNLPKETATTLRDGWLYTGDLAKIDSDGFLYIMGRLKEMINVRGLNVYPKEIEDLLFKHPAVKETAVVGVMHRHRGEVPIAFVTKKDEVSEKEILQYLRANIAPYKVPLKIFFKDTLPKNATGKVLKTVLQKEVESVFLPS